MGKERKSGISLKLIIMRILKDHGHQEFWKNGITAIFCRGIIFLSVTKALLLGKKPEIPNYPVCVECKLKENQCVFELGMFCLGPVTRAGCGALCPTNRHGCEGCRGYVDNPNRDSEMEVLEKHGLTVEDAMKRLGIFLGHWEAPRNE